MEFVDAGDAKKRENVRLSENGDKEWYRGRHSTMTSSPGSSARWHRTA